MFLLQFYLCSDRFPVRDRFGRQRPERLFFAILGNFSQKGHSPFPFPLHFHGESIHFYYGFSSDLFGKSASRLAERFSLRQAFWKGFHLMLDFDELARTYLDDIYAGSV